MELLHEQSIGVRWKAPHLFIGFLLIRWLVGRFWVMMVSHRMRSLHTVQSGASNFNRRLPHNQLNIKLLNGGDLLQPQLEVLDLLLRTVGGWRRRGRRYHRALSIVLKIPFLDKLLYVADRVCSEGDFGFGSVVPIFGILSRLNDDGSWHPTTGRKDRYGWWLCGVTLLKIVTTLQAYQVSKLIVQLPLQELEDENELELLSQHDLLLKDDDHLLAIHWHLVRRHSRYPWMHQSLTCTVPL